MASASNAHHSRKTANSKNAGSEFKSAVKRYGGERSPLAVKGISFTAILGPSGDGKTTTLRMIAGLKSPCGGHTFIDGCDVTSPGPAERNVSIFFQSSALFPHTTVLSNVSDGLNASGVKPAQMFERAKAAMASFGLSGFDDRLPSELSGGQQQRVALARVLLLAFAAFFLMSPC